MTTAAFAPLAHANNWQLVWSDEFEYTGLPDESKWDYEEGFIRNKESQYYTRRRMENARVENGSLILECRNDHFIPQNPRVSPWSQVASGDQGGIPSIGLGTPVPFTSASLITKHKASWQYGRVEVRAKLPQGKGVWPAIWMLGTSFIKDEDWPSCGEIDIMEFVGNEPGHIHGTLHYSAEGRHRKIPGKLAVNPPLNGFHVYAIEWTADRIDFLFDGAAYHSVPLDGAGKGSGNPFRKPFFLLINFALGGSWGGPIDPAILPQQFVVDYVRVYKASGAR